MSTSYKFFNPLIENISEQFKEAQIGQEQNIAYSTESDVYKIGFHRGFLEAIVKLRKELEQIDSKISHN